ncbi:MAG: acyl-CoA dehydrogenase family protein [Halioglobus sp.]
MEKEMQALLTDNVNRIFSDAVDKNALDRAERGEFSSQLWEILCENGFHLLANTDSGAELADVFAILRVAGRYAVPLPLAETLLGNRWLNNQSNEIITIGEKIGDQITALPWFQSSTHHLGVTRKNELFEISIESSSVGSNIAFEPRGVSTGNFTQISCDEKPYELMALSRMSLSVGALQTLLEMTINYVAERQQFGRAIGKFQAVQHNLAVAAAELAAATRACDGAVESIGEARFGLEVAAGKSRIGEAITVITEIAHQLHGAMGFTHEHRLHHFTRRLWSWRDEYGNETYWQSLLGHHIYTLGADNAWDFIATTK